MFSTVSSRLQEVRLFPGLGGLQFVVAVGRHHAAVFRCGAAEAWLVGDGFGSRVDQPAQFRFFGPGRHEPLYRTCRSGDPAPRCAAGRPIKQGGSRACE